MFAATAVLRIVLVAVPIFRLSLLHEIFKVCTIFFLRVVRVDKLDISQRSNSWRHYLVQTRLLISAGLIHTVNNGQLLLPLSSPVRHDVLILYALTLCKSSLGRSTQLPLKRALVENFFDMSPMLEHAVRHCQDIFNEGNLLNDTSAPALPARPSIAVVLRAK